MNETRYRTFLNTADLTGKNGYVVGYDTSNVGQVVLANAQTVPLAGILWIENQQALAKSRVTVIMPQVGTAAVVYGGTVTIGAYLTPDATGRLIATTTTGDHVIAIAKEAGGVGEWHEVELCNFLLH